MANRHVACQSFVLQKNADSLADTMSYRILLLLPSIYRRWAATRLRDLASWVSLWATDHMFAGVAGRGASDRWYQTAILLERCQLTASPFVGGAVDILKCFDQIHRGLIYKLAASASLPHRILQAYSSFHENVWAYNSIAGALGSPYRKPTSIPQGCPLSMTIVALIMCPWVSLITTLTAIPRVLADDILLITTGPTALCDFTTALDTTHQYLSRLGARVAPNKSITFASSPAHRRFLAKHIWQYIGQTIQLVLLTSDLGAHINTTIRITSSTLNNRMEQAIDLIYRMAWLPLEPHVLATAIRTRAFPKAFYACEASSLPAKSLAAIRTAVARAICRTANHTSTCLVFDTHTAKRDIDPVCEILYKRFLTLRRFWAYDDNDATKLSDISIIMEC